MKCRVKLLSLAVIGLLCSLLLGLSCSYDGSYFENLKEPSPCPAGESLCDNTCVTLDTKEHCGECRNSCTFDRYCRKTDHASYQCACPDDRRNCGSNLRCSLLDGGIEGDPKRDPRCGDCNTICSREEFCHHKNCVCRIDEDTFIIGDDKKPLHGEALSQEYLRNDQHCGACKQACNVQKGEHCVLGQCIKTKCNNLPGLNEECHFTRPDGREDCQKCSQKCMEMSTIPPGTQTALLPELGKGSNPQLNSSNTSYLAYDLDDNKNFSFKRVLGCFCQKGKCESGTSDRCDEGQCVCGADADHCEDKTTCTSDGCKVPCDKVGRACAGKSVCTEKQCLCGHVIPEDMETGPKNAHCIDGLKCVDGQCQCPVSGAICGLRGDRCANGACVCGDQSEKACEDDAFCDLGLCKCGKTASICDSKLNPNCINGQCKCGRGPNAVSCTVSEECKDGQCQCIKDDACLKYGNLDNVGRGQADTCSLGKCFCGYGPPCTNNRICVAGQCVCTENSDCPHHETCVENQCTCGGAKACRGDSYCRSDGYCGCTNNYICNDEEACMWVNGIGQICVCSATYKQKACRYGASCGPVDGQTYYRCRTSDPRACHSGEVVIGEHCTCGDSQYACNPGRVCIDKACK